MHAAAVELLRFGEEDGEARRMEHAVTKRKIARGNEMSLKATRRKFQDLPRLPTMEGPLNKEKKTPPRFAERKKKTERLFSLGEGMPGSTVQGTDPRSGGKNRGSLYGPP